MSRHVRHRCKIANSEEAMDKLVEHTLQRQDAELATKVDRLTALVEQTAVSQLALAPAGGGGPAAAGNGNKRRGANRGRRHRQHNDQHSG